MIIFIRAGKWNAGILFLGSVLALGGCVVEKPALWGDPQTGLILT